MKIVEAAAASLPVLFSCSPTSLFAAARVSSSATSFTSFPNVQTISGIGFSFSMFSTFSSLLLTLKPSVSLAQS